VSVLSTTLLSRFPKVATSDVEEARSEVAGEFCAHYLSLTRRGAKLDAVHNAAPIGSSISLNYLRYGDEVRITPGTLDTFYLVQIPLAGSARVKVGSRVVASDRRFASLASPTEPVDMIWSDGCEQLLVYLDRAVVDDYVRTPGAGRPASPVVFDPLVDLTSPQVSGWLRLVHLARQELELGSGLFSGDRHGADLMAAHFEQVLVSGLLAAQPNSSHLAPEGPTPAGSRTVRLAMDLIAAEPERPWRVAELAREVGVSARTLQDAFQREHGISPLEQVRRVRLDRARTDLLNADPSTTSVTTVASRWGYFHLGRFAQVYRRRFGESPSQTLAT
jgi:AraC-like DNA-binding protein